MNEEMLYGNEDEELKLDLGTFLFGLVGAIVSWVNMLFIYQIQIKSSNELLKVFMYLSIIFTTVIPCVGIGLKNRLWGYGYILGFALAGLPFIFIVDLFIGAYTFATTLFLFIILWLIFWKTWRSLSSIKMVSE
ncbi:MAG: conserved membrane protein of unknown function [Promethearchaeota archaeon]|nr:MAG: conserved membrane protein of unknown function [Candidatus Lokiarchaeota archaeon]